MRRIWRGHVVALCEFPMTHPTHLDGLATAFMALCVVLGAMLFIPIGLGLCAGMFLFFGGSHALN